MRVPVLGAGSVTTQDQVRVIKALGLAGFMLSDALLLAKESPIPDSWRTKVMYLADSASETSDTFMAEPHAICLTALPDLPRERSSRPSVPLSILCTERYL